MGEEEKVQIITVHCCSLICFLTSKAVEFLSKGSSESGGKLPHLIVRVLEFIGVLTNSI